MPAWLFLGALNGLIAVAAGAYGRHGGLTPEGREMFQIAGQFQLAHALALLAVGLGFVPLEPSVLLQIGRPGAAAVVGR